jgi:hypothetical protein
MNKMSFSSWIAIAALSSLLALAGFTAFREWTLVGAVQIPPYGYAAITVGILFSLIVGVGLMALIFISSRYGFDEPAILMSEKNDGDQRSRSSKEKA